MNYVIIGNSVAAVHAVMGIREYDQDNPITIISAENYYAYGRPLISYWLEGRVKNKNILYRPEEFYKENKVQLLLGRRAVSINPDSKQVELDDGNFLSYDRLLIATGGRPFIPEIKGLNPKNHFTFMNYDDVRKLEPVAAPGKEAVVIGAGPTGLKAMESLVKRGVRVTLVELADRVWSQALDAEAASMVTSFLQQRGVNLYLNDTVQSIEQKKNDRLDIKLNSGCELQSDLLVLAIGVRPNVELLKSIPGVNINRGVVVGPDLNIGLPDVYAAGDVVADSPPLFPHAAVQGRIAGRNMAGNNDNYKPIPPYNALGILGLNIVSMGNSIASDENYELLVETEREALIYRKLVIKENRLVGGLMINKIDRAGIYHKLIEEGADITSIKDELLNPNFGLLSFPEPVWQRQLAH
ncbi:MAG: hypothetical protein PWP31_270 [Clostridia bacterium]|nr:hypothetical protein [Clostridia bacterium]